MKNRIVYSSHYDFSLWGLDKLHPFDVKKLGIAKFLPAKVLTQHLITPIRYATQGSILAAKYAMQNNAIAMNLGGGYHHAFADHGEGFCFYADAALAIIKLRRDGLLKQQDGVAMIDLDAHRGNGFESFFMDDPNVSVFDMYNFQIYSGVHTGDVDDYPFMVPLRSKMAGEEYLGALKTELPKFLSQLNQTKLVFYNAGTDILQGDPLGGLSVAFDQVVERDAYVLDQLRDLGIPVVVMTSGGYTSDSHKLIAECTKLILSS